MKAVWNLLKLRLCIASRFSSTLGFSTKMLRTPEQTSCYPSFISLYPIARFLPPENCAYPKRITHLHVYRLLPPVHREERNRVYLADKDVPDPVPNTTRGE